MADATRRSHGRGQPFRRELATYLEVLAEAADVVYFEAANVAARYAAVLGHLGPKVVMCTGSDVRILPDLNPWLERALPEVFAMTAHVICRSEDLRHWAVRRGAPAARTDVLYPAVDTGFFSPPCRPSRLDSEVRLVSVGRHHWVKGYEYTIQALSLARQTGADLTYTIVGAEEGSGQGVRYAVRDLGLTDVVTLVGAKSVAGVAPRWPERTCSSCPASARG